MATKSTQFTISAPNRVKKWFKQNKYALLIIGFTLLAWAFYSQFINTRGDVYFPSINYVLAQSAANSDTLITALQVTIIETIGGWFIGMIFGLIVGVFFAEITFVKQSFFPAIVFWQALPMAVLAPMFIVWFGTGPLTVMLFAGLSSFWALMINTMTGFGTVEEEFGQLGSVIGTSRWQQLRYIRLWAAMPHITTGLKIGAQQAVVGAIVAEFVASGAGVGYIVKSSVSQLQTGLMFFALILIMVFSVIFFKSIEVFLDYITPGPSA